MEQLLPYVAQQLKKVLIEMEKRGHPMKVTSTYRSWDEQNELYEQGRSRPGKKVTNAQGGYSWHNYKVAIDMCFVNGEPFGETQPWSMYGDVAKLYGLSWGGDWTSFPDRPHIQMDYGQDITSLRRMGEEKAIAKLKSLDDSHMAKNAGEGDVSPWAILSVQKAKAKGIIKNWSNPSGEMSWEDIRWMLKKLGIQIEISQKPITRQEWAVIWDRLKLLD